MRWTIRVLVTSALLLAGAGESRFAAVAAPPDAGSLYAHSAARVLTRGFSSPELSFILIDARTETILAARWPRSEENTPIGSLVKPFLALTYAEAHGFKFPEHVCKGGTTCWLPTGHGRLGIVRATAMSCNSYYESLAAGVTASEVTTVARQFGLGGPGMTTSSEALIGKFGFWRESPVALLHAYAELLRRRAQPGVREIVDGMAIAAEEGTAIGISRAHLRTRVIAKTGTSACTHDTHSSGDGFTLVAWPADVPQYLLLVRKHGAPGSEAAVVAGQMLRSLEPQS